MNDHYNAPYLFSPPEHGPGEAPLQNTLRWYPVRVEPGLTAIVDQLGFRVTPPISTPTAAYIVHQHMTALGYPQLVEGIDDVEEELARQIIDHINDEEEELARQIIDHINDEEEDHE